jgi:ATP-binding cassette subfamily C protein CydC
LDAARRALGVVNQSPHIFDTTLDENLRIGQALASDESMAHAIAIAGLGPLIASLPQGLDTILGSRGVTLSGGEIKRIAIARIVLKDAPILLLDEPTEGLDPESARLVLSDLFAWAKGRALIWVTHHLSNLDLIDDIAVMDRGKICDHGTFAVLRQQSAWVQSMIRHQRIVIPSA